MLRLRLSRYYKLLQLYANRAKRYNYNLGNT